MSLIRTLSEMQANEKLQPDPVTCPFCGAVVEFVKEGKRVIARCLGKGCGYEVQKGECDGHK